MSGARIATGIGVIGIGIATVLAAQEISPVSFELRGQAQTITQQDRIDGASVAAHFMRPQECPGVCVAPMQAADGVATVGELEVIGFVTSLVAEGEGLLIDSRSPETITTLGIVSAVNVPAELLGEDNPFRSDILVALGAREFQGVFNFADAMPLMVFDSGPSSTEAATLITSLVDLGYPTDRISYYRGGMQVWSALGLSMEEL